MFWEFHTDNGGKRSPPELFSLKKNKKTIRETRIKKQILFSLDRLSVVVGAVLYGSSRLGRS